MTDGGRQRVSVVTLGVTDVVASRSFYEAWGWVAHYISDEVVFFQGNGLVIALFESGDLAADQSRPGAALGTGAMTLAQNYGTKAEVDERFQSAIAAGAGLLKRPQAAEWGGYSGYVCDPDGHVWELAMNQFWELGDDGSVVMPDAPAGA